MWSYDDPSSLSIPLIHSRSSMDSKCMISFSLLYLPLTRSGRVLSCPVNTVIITFIHNPEIYRNHFYTTQQQPVSCSVNNFCIYPISLKTNSVNWTTALLWSAFQFLVHHIPVCVVSSQKFDSPVGLQMTKYYEQRTSLRKSLLLFLSFQFFSMRWT